MLVCSDDVLVTDRKLCWFRDDDVFVSVADRKLYWFGADDVLV